MLDRFQLFVILRTQVSDRSLVARALAVEAAMEELAPGVGLDVETCRLAGLGAYLDAQLCLANPDRRGEVAAELLLAEGAPEPVARAARQCYREPEVSRLSELAALLVAADALVEEIYEQLAEVPLDDVSEAFAVSRRAMRCLDRLGVAVGDAAATALAGMRRVREDLRL